MCCVALSLSCCQLVTSFHHCLQLTKHGILTMLCSLSNRLLLPSSLHVMWSVSSRHLSCSAQFTRRLRLRVNKQNVMISAVCLASSVKRVQCAHTVVCTNRINSTTAFCRSYYNTDLTERSEHTITLTWNVCHNQNYDTVDFADNDAIQKTS